MTDTGSALLDKIVGRRRELNGLFRRKPTRILQLPHVENLPMLRMAPEKSVAERVAEAKRFSGKIPAWKLYKIIDCIKSCDKRSVPKIMPSSVAVVAIQTAVAEHFDMSIEEMNSKDRHKQKVLPRHVAMYLTRILTSRSFSEIGHRFGMGHAAVVHATRKITKLVAKDATFADEIEELKSRCGFG